MGGQKEKLAINAIIALIYRVQQKWEKKKIATILFMNIKVAFDHVSKEQLLIWMIKLRVDGNLMTWTTSFLIDLKIQLVIDGHNTKEKKIETRIPQSFPMASIFFLIYISGVFT